ncbi:MAG: Mur ligase family protein, partial [Myxococcota bacterium]
MEPELDASRWLIGVTGTNGKTTTATLVGHLLARAGWDVATVTTVETHVRGEVVPTRDLRAVLGSGCRAVVQECTSWSLERGLTRLTPFDVGAFTNLSHDHLDQHGGSFERYLAAKAQLFASLGRSPHARPVAVLRADDPASDLLAEVLDPRVQVV